jgi:hypothetical protein
MQKTNNKTTIDNNLDNKNDIKIGDIIQVPRKLIRIEKTKSGFNIYTVKNGYRILIWRNSLEIAKDLEVLELEIIKEIDNGYYKVFVARLNLKR